MYDILKDLCINVCMTHILMGKAHTNIATSSFFPHRLRYITKSPMNTSLRL